MRVNLSEESMDIVMFIVKKHNLTLNESIDFIIKNPEEIAITRGELNGRKWQFKKVQKS